jgi:hypothetical protein
MNKYSSLIIRLLCPQPVFFWAYLLPVLYWIYLTLTTNFILVFDSEDYFNLAHYLYDPGLWTKYYITGPNREPLYPLVIAISMHVGHWLGISYTYPLKILSFGFLAATMVLIQRVLKLFNARPWIQAATILYTGFSPILINSALCLYSEIAAFPWLVAVILLSIHYVRSLQEAPSKNLAPAIALGCCLLGFTLVKGMGEILAPLFLGWLILYGWRQSGLRMAPFLRMAKIKILLVLLVFYVPLQGHKILNYALNGHFTLTNRGITILYGSMITRAQNPMTMENFLAHVISVPLTYPVCPHFFNLEKCNQAVLSTSDDMYVQRLGQLKNQNFSAAQSENLTRKEILQTFIDHPLSQSVYFFTEGLKMFFWETSQGAFTVYPPWLERLFNIPFVVMFMSLAVGCLCMIGFLLSWTSLKNETILVTVVLTSLLIVLTSIVNIHHRLTLPVAPLMILLNAFCLQAVSAKVPGFFASKAQKTR